MRYRLFSMGHMALTSRLPPPGLPPAGVGRSALACVPVPARAIRSLSPHALGQSEARLGEQLELRLIPRSTGFGPGLPRTQAGP